jgi:DNA-binding NtrC family response regulator
MGSSTTNFKRLPLAAAEKQLEQCRDQILLAISTHSLDQEVKRLLKNHGFKHFENLFDFETITAYVLKKQPILLILESPWLNGVDILKEVSALRQLERRLPIILVTTDSSEALAISALRVGIKDYFTTPIPTGIFNAAVNQWIANNHSRAICANNSDTIASMTSEQFVGESFQIRRVKDYLNKLASMDSHVLITGETGTGKELIAEHIHQHSHRNDKPFIAINCAAIPDGLLESELFGYAKGAFTGANFSYAGKLRLAEGGTIFFDEIGDMSPYAQAKILRVLESKEVYPLGGKHSIPLDVRIIAATNCNLENMISTKDFRQDLYFRLNVARVQLPPLRERKEDIVSLVNYFLEKFNALFGRNIFGFTEEAWELLLKYDWPGNVRELKNFLEAIYIELLSGVINESDLPDFLRSPDTNKPEKVSYDERELLFSTLCSVNWNKSKAAEKLHWSRMTLYRKMTKYQIIHS